MSASVSVVVPAYGEPALCARALATAQADLGPRDSELIVVDDASPEPLAAWIAERFPAAHTITRPRNGGFAAAANAGIARARHELVWLLNSDVAVQPGALERLERELRCPDVFAASPRVVLEGRPDAVESYAFLARAGGRLRLEQPGLAARSALPDEPVDVDFPHGGAMLVHRARFTALGGFVAGPAPFYLEDADLGRRAAWAGWRVRYVPRAVVLHRHRATIGARVPERAVRAAIESGLWSLTRAEDEAAGRSGWRSAARRALVDAALSGTLRDEATWLALSERAPRP